MAWALDINPKESLELDTRHTQAMPKVQRRYGGNDAHRSSRRSSGRLDEEEASDEEEFNDETLTFDSQPDWAARTQPNPRQHKPPPPQPQQRGFRAPSPPQQQQQQEEETLDFGSGGDFSPRMVRAFPLVEGTSQTFSLRIPNEVNVAAWGLGCIAGEARAPCRRRREEATDADGGLWGLAGLPEPVSRGVR